MQFKVSIVTLVILSSMFGYTSAQCQPKQPMEHFKPNLVEGKFYLIAMERGFPYQNREARCGTSDIRNASQQIFNNVITYQNSNGNLETFILKIENTFPAGSYNVSGGDGTKFQAVILGSIRKRVHIIFGCNPQDNREAVWVYYSSRVQGLRRMDAHSQQYVVNTLNNNDILLNDLQNIDNNNCNN